jgi:Domain of unknown function (DUF4405)
MSKPVTTSRPNVNFWLDAALLAVFAAIIVLGFRYAGMPPTSTSLVHEALGVGMAAAVILHLVLHGNWIVSTTRALFSRLPRRTRINQALFLALLLLFGVITVSGVMLSGTLGLRADAAMGWRGAHHASTKLAILVVAVHVVLHWHWIARRFEVHLLASSRAKPIDSKSSCVAVEIAQQPTEPSPTSDDTSASVRVRGDGFDDPALATRFPRG